jgi:hypothetical protein
MTRQMRAAYTAGIMDMLIRNPGLVFRDTPAGPIATCIRKLGLTPDVIVQAVDADYRRADERDYTPALVMQGFVTDKIASCVSGEMRALKELVK